MDPAARKYSPLFFFPFNIRFALAAQDTAMLVLLNNNNRVVKRVTCIHANKPCRPLRAAPFMHVKIETMTARHRHFFALKNPRTKKVSLSLEYAIVSPLARGSHYHMLGSSRHRQKIRPLSVTLWKMIIGAQKWGISHLFCLSLWAHLPNSPIIIIIFCGLANQCVHRDSLSLLSGSFVLIRSN